MFQATNIQTPEDLNRAANEIQAFLEAEFNADVSASCVARAEELAGYMAHTGKMLADAKYHYNTLLNSEIIKALKDQDKMTASTLNNYIKAMCKDYQYLVDWIDRINASCTHQIDLIRSLISKHKEELKLSGWQK
jgi:hypothetical protein